MGRGRDTKGEGRVRLGWKGAGVPWGAGKQREKGGSGWGGRVQVFFERAGTPREEGRAWLGEKGEVLSQNEALSEAVFAGMGAASVIQCLVTAA